MVVRGTPLPNRRLEATPQRCSDELPSALSADEGRASEKERGHAMTVIVLAAILAIQPQNEANCGRPRNQLEINYCAYAEFQRADTALNRQWKKTLAMTRRHPEWQRPELHGGKSDGQLLVESQRAWLRFRDAQCLFEESFMPGSGGPAMRSACLTNLTEDRTKYLRDTYPAFQ